MIFYIFEKLDRMQLKHFKKHIRKYKHTHSLFFLIIFYSHTLTTTFLQIIKIQNNSIKHVQKFTN
jgi:hypothetical protein